MKPFTVNSTSWHYKLLAKSYSAKYSINKDRVHIIMPNNFCSYFRSVTLTLLYYAVLAGIVATILFYVGIGLYKLALIIIAYPGESLQGALLIAAGMLALASVIGAITFAVHKYDNYEVRKQQEAWDKASGRYVEPEHGLLVTKYLAWKSKICPAIEYKK